MHKNTAISIIEALVRASRYDLAAAAAAEWSETNLNSNLGLLPQREKSYYVATEIRAAYVRSAAVVGRYTVLEGQVPSANGGTRPAVLALVSGEFTINHTGGSPESVGTTTVVHGPDSFWRL